MKNKFEKFIANYDYTRFSDFLVNLDWVNDGTYNEVFSVWHRRAAAEFDYEAILPITRNIKKYEQTMQNALGNICEYYKKSIDDLIDEYNKKYLDKLKFQIKSDASNEGIIPLNEGVRLIDNSKELLVSSFLASAKKKKNYIGQRPDTINDLIEKVEMGQTEEGSYIINLYIPNNYYIDGSVPLIEEESLSRKSISILELASSTIIQKISEYQTNNDLSIFDDAVSSGVSSNMCYAINEMTANGKSDLNIQIEKNNGLMTESIISNIHFDHSIIPIVKIIADYYRKDLVEDDYELRGIVTKLHQEPDDIRGEISVSAIIDDKLKHVKMQLDARQYLIAIQAHKTHIEIICRGKLIQRDRITILSDITSILLSEENEE